MQHTCKYVHKQLWRAWGLGKELTDLHHKLVKRDLYMDRFSTVTYTVRYGHDIWNLKHKDPL